MLKLAQGIAERQYPVDLVLARAEGPYLEDVPDTIRVVDLKASRVVKSLPALVRYLRHERPSVMLSTLDYANVVALWARRLAGVPRRAIVIEQNTISWTSRNSSSFKGRLMPPCLKRFYPWATHIVGNSRGVAEDLSLLTGLASDRIRVIYNPVITNDLPEKAQAPLDHPWFEFGQPPVVLSVGRLKVQKDFPSLIKAFAEVRKTRRARLLILGEGPDRASLEALVTKLGLEKDVSLPGFVRNPYAYMSRAFLYVLSSGWEGLPTVLIEALYCGANIIATDCPSGPREILANGRYGKLVPVGDPIALAQAMGCALADERQRLRPESWQPYTMETVVNQYLDVLFEH